MAVKENNDSTSLRRRRGSIETPATIPKNDKNDHNGANIDDRFQRQAEKDTCLKEPCVFTIDGRVLDVTAWAKAHPGGSQILQQYHNKDASQAFEAVQHSQRACAMLGRFAVHKGDNKTKVIPKTNKKPTSLLARVAFKMFTHEDRFNVHKSLGLFCLANFAYRFGLLMLTSNLTAGLATWTGLLSLIPHALLSGSSLIFRTVPRERVVGQPMIWQEFRAHSIVFGIRSVLCSAAASLSILLGEPYRNLAVVISGMVVIASLVASGKVTERLAPSRTESTTATMPYWKGCPPSLERLFKKFYALSQFGATIGCLMVSSPAWPFAILFPIQGAALLMTLVRKGFLTPKGYHTIYATMLSLVFVVGPLPYVLGNWTSDFLIIFGTGVLAYELRCRGVNKYAIWIPIVLLRVLVGDYVLDYRV